MPIDYAEKEREFLSSLREDTGRDLAGWMAAIAQTKLADRNAIIHWLRQQGFLFARASWLERIYHNGGRPIYLGAAPPASAAKPSELRPEPAAELATSVPPALNPAPSPAAPASGHAAAPPTAESGTPLALDTLLSEAKGYRPLAQHVLREIERAAPGAVLEPRAGYVAILCNGRLAGVLTLAPKELRLGLSLSTHAAPDPFTKAKFPKTHPDIPSDITHMVILNDARQVTAQLIGVVAQAVAKV